MKCGSQSCYRAAVLHLPPPRQCCACHGAGYVFVMRGERMVNHVVSSHVVCCCWGRDGDDDDGKDCGVLVVYGLCCRWFVYWGPPRDGSCYVLRVC